MVDTRNLNVADLRQNLAGANPAVLLAALVSITGDLDRVEHFATALTHEPAAAGIKSILPSDIHAELEAWALEVLPNLAAYAGHDFLSIDDDTFATLSKALVGWPMHADSVAYYKDQAGFSRNSPTKDRAAAVPEGFSVAVVGAGMAGIALSIAADQAGIDFVVLDKNEGLGGVWWRNRYPGVGVDTASQYYSFSFELNPDWTHRYPEGGQYLDYLEAVAQKYGVLDRFRFGAEVTELFWDDAAQSWEVTYFQDGERKHVRSNAVVTAAGYLNRPALPAVPGLDTFEGLSMHSADADSTLDVGGKRLGIVGTGCTAVQLVDALAGDAASLTLVQRQPHWVLPTNGETRLRGDHQWLLANVPTYALWDRLHTFIPMGDTIYGAIRYDDDWAATHEMSISAMNDRLLQPALRHLNTSFADRPDLLAALKPNFSMMGKRPVRDPGAYYSTIKAPTTTLVTSALAEVVPEGIRDGEGNIHELDVIVYATGFTLEYLSSITIVGKDGVKLSDVWQDTPRAYNGCLVPGFPNLFITSGPNASPAHGSSHNFTVEAVSNYVIESLHAIFDAGGTSVEVTPEAFARWNEEIHEVMAGSIWAKDTRATTYMRNAKGDIVMPCPLRLDDYWNRLRGPDLADIVLR